MSEEALCQLVRCSGFATRLAKVSMNYERARQLSRLYRNQAHRAGTGYATKDLLTI